MLMPSRHFRLLGYSLVELMVAITIGLILTSAVTGLVVANMRNTNSVVRGMRVTEESRALTEIMTRELRRVRYDALATSRIGSGTTGTVFKSIAPSTVNVASDCIKYSYDANGDGLASTGEFRMFSRGTASGRGVVRYGQFNTAAAVDCALGTVLTSDDIDVGCLRFISATADTTLTSSSAAACYSPAPAIAVTLPIIPAGSLYFSLRMSLQSDPLSLASRRTDAMVMIRSPVIGP